ncbi:MAG: hypothetical protein JWP88_652 [Flaviaesturariibacter sp.]|nr:hypothetical protein [Flaviaesturariibacter sp.]
MRSVAKHHFMRQALLAVFLFVSLYTSAQFSIGIFGGTSNYQGDLVGRAFVGRFTKAAIGPTISYAISERFSLRGGATWARISGDDRYNTKTYLQARNLNFESKLKELSLVGVYTFFNREDLRWSPYVFGGLALFHFNPYTHDSVGAIVNLKPLSTEGQGLTAYPDRKPYKLTQWAIPFGGGIKYALSDRFDIALEAGIRKTFTDYLDDVSKNYVDQADLLAERGQQAVDYAYRGDEVPGGNSNYPAKGAQRGASKGKDTYYFTGLHLTFHLGSGGTGGGKRTRNMGCPSVN